LVGRQDRGREPDPLRLVGRVVAHPRLSQLELAGAGEDLARGQVPVSDHAPVAAGVASCLMLVKEILDLGLDGGLAHALRALVNDLVQGTALVKLLPEPDYFRVELRCLWL